MGLLYKNVEQVKIHPNLI